MGKKDNFKNLLSKYDLTIRQVADLTDFPYTTLTSQLRIADRTNSYDKLTVKLLKSCADLIGITPGIFLDKLEKNTQDCRDQIKFDDKKFVIQDYHFDTEDKYRAVKKAILNNNIPYLPTRTDIKHLASSIDNYDSKFWQSQWMDKSLQTIINQNINNKFLKQKNDLAK